jgi:TIGR01244 family protein
MQTLKPALYVSAQIQPGELPALQAQGIAQIICHRPDGEEPAQPAFADIAAAATALGIRALHLPVAGGQFSAETVAATRDALAEGTPTLMYCKSGMRSTTAWALGEAAAGGNADEIIARAATCGYDLSPLRARLTASA